jgi:hypothetical protein
MIGAWFPKNSASRTMFHSALGQFIARKLRIQSITSRMTLNKNTMLLLWAKPTATGHPILNIFTRVEWMFEFGALGGSIMLFLVHEIR